MDSTIKMVQRHLKKHGGRVHYGLWAEAAGIRPALLEIALDEFKATHPVSTFPTSDGGELAASYEGDSSGFTVVTATWRHMESGRVVADNRRVLSASVGRRGGINLRLDDTEASIVKFFASLVEAMRQRFPKAELSDEIEARRVDLGGGKFGGGIRREVQTVTPTGDAPNDDADQDTPSAGKRAGEPPAWVNEDWYLSLTIEDRQRYDWLRPLKDDWEAGRKTEAYIAEKFGKTVDTTRGWRRSLNQKGAPEMDWKKNKGQTQKGV